MATLIFDADERALLAEARDQARALLPLDRLLRPESLVDAWSKLGRIGWQLAYVPEEAGGAGISLPVLVGLAHAAGAQLAIEDFVTNAYCLPAIALAIGAPDVRGHVLQGLVDRPGFLVVDGRRSDLRAPASSETDWVCGVIVGGWAYALRHDSRGWTLARWEQSRYTCRPTSDLAPGVATVRLIDEPTESVALEATDADVERWAQTAQLVHAAGLVGLAAEALDRSVSHALLRKQFGRVIGEFQAVKHALATVSATVEAAWSMCLYAACSVSAGDIAAAHILATDAAVAAAKTMVHTHGGMGFTWEHPAHLFLKTALIGAQRFDPDGQRRAAIDNAVRLTSDGGGESP